MSPETLQAITAGAVAGLTTAVGTVLLVASWLNKAFSGLKQLQEISSTVNQLKEQLSGAKQKLDEDIAEAERVARATHGRLDGHTERIAKLEAREEAREAERARSQKALDDRLASIDGKLDQVFQHLLKLPGGVR